MNSLSALWRDFWTDSRGISAVEAAIALPVLAFALAGTLEFGMNVYNRQQLQAAVQAGIQYALYNPTDEAGVRSAILAALPADSGATIQKPDGSNGIEYVCECDDGTTIQCYPMGGCPSGSPRKLIIMYVQREPMVLVSMLVGFRPGKLRAQGAVNIPTS